ncbi:unnamed protein product [Phytophthora fragariaefolia]|uniref:Unnamed protein product n=1 Tax=Phytophthora fragariaefolia TaxID=1490495 RepID=A0A9W6U6H9_9STRA|nr:unnamed protein product [Phytophthora fragariaefolia]
MSPSTYETTDFFKEIGATLLAWPARSPDLNPIENVWALRADKVYSHGKQYHSVPELKAAVMKAWDSVTMEEITTLLDSMGKRCFEVAKRLGDKTHY